MLGEERVESPDLVYGDPEPGVDGDHLLAGGKETDNLPAACVPRIKKVKYLALKTEISVVYSIEIMPTLLLDQREVVQSTRILKHPFAKKMQYVAFMVTYSVTPNGYNKNTC